MSRNVLASNECGFVYLIRKLTGLNQEDFGVLIGVSKNSVSAYETMQCFPSVYALQNIVALGIEASDLLCYITSCFLKDEDLNFVCDHYYYWYEQGKCFYVRYEK